jgi:alpha/beta hydrolase fold
MGEGNMDSKVSRGWKSGLRPIAETSVRRGIAVPLSAGAMATVAYFTASTWAIRHKTITFYDASRDNRPVAVDIAVRRDKEMQASAGMIRLPVAVVNHGNTVKHTEYSFLANLMAARGYEVISIQHDLPNDPPMVTKVGELFVGRLTQIQRGVANIRFAVEEMRKVQSNADYDHLTVVGHSMGGDITMYFAKQYPDEVKKVVTLDNLRVPFITSGKFKILSFRSKDPEFKTDPGVIPSDEECEKAGITVVKTTFQHNDMRDTGSEDAKASIQGMLDKFLTDTENEDAKPVETSAPNVLDPGPVAPYVPVGKEAKTALTHSRLP